MEIVIKILIGLAALGFLLAVIGVLFLSGKFLGVSAEAYSRSCSNLALIAIALSYFLKKEK